MAKNPRELEIWKLSYELVLDFYKITDKFPEDESNNLTSQIRRAAVSIPLNIAEGCSRQTKRSFMQFLQYAYGSGKELDVLLMLSRDIGYITNEKYDDMFFKLEVLMKKMWKFMKFVNREKFFNYFKQKAL